MRPLIDSHTHLETFHRKGVLDEVLERAKAAGVEHVVTVGTNSEDWGLYQQLAKDYRGTVFYTVGIHPSGMGDDWREQLAEIEGYFSQSENRPVAVGEIGLDRFHLSEDPERAEMEMVRQKEAFRAQLAIAGNLKMPVVVHSRGAFDECVEIVDESDVSWERVVFHCFTEGAAEIRKLNERGGRGSFTGILTYKKADEVREAALAQGLARFMIETDAPYLAPVPYRGKSNEPAYLRATAELAAELFEVSLEELAERMAETTRRFYALDCV